jgi:streptogramin lyase
LKHSSSLSTLILALAAGACSSGGAAANVRNSDGGTTASDGGSTTSGAAPSSGGSAPSTTGSAGASGTSTANGGTSTGGTSGTVAGSGSPGSAGTTSAGGAAPSAPINSVPGPQITITEFVVSTNASPAPGGISAGSDGRIWFLHQDTGPSALGAVTTDGATFALYKVNTTNIGPVAINLGPDGNIWYTKQQGIGKMQPSGTFNEYGAPGGAQTGGIIKGPDGNMWYTEPDADRIGNITMSGQTKDYPLPAKGKAPNDITLGPDGNLWFTEKTGNNIGRITPAGVVTEYAIPTAASNPQAITTGPDGNMWFTEHDSHNIGRITPMGKVTEFGIPSGARPYRIAAGPDGNLWFTEPGMFNAIGRCTPAGGISEYPIPTANTDVEGITAGPDKNLWFAETDSEKIGRISNLTGGGNLASATGAFGTTLSTSGPCTKDIDCISSGKACGGDVCSHKGTTPQCVFAVSADPGYCSAASDCWCASQGATCDATSHHCSTTTP